MNTNFIHKIQLGALAIAALLFFVAANNVSAAIAVDGTVSTGGGITPITTFTISHTVSGADRLLIVGVSVRDSAAVISGVTYGGTGLNLVGSHSQNTVTSRVAMYLYRLINPPAGTANVVVTASEDATAMAAGVISFTGVDQTTPLGTFASAGGASAEASVNVTSVVGELVIDTFAQQNSSAVHIVGAGQTQRWSLHQGTGASHVGGGGSTEPGAATVTMSWTGMGSTNNNWAIGAVSIRPSAADITPPTVTIDQATGQTDPTGTSPINFTVVFSESVSNFATGDVTLGGTAGATTAAVTGSGTTYNVAVSGMTGSGTVIASVAAGVATDAAGNPSTASMSADNTVTYNAPDTVPPTANITAPTAGQIFPAGTTSITLSATTNETATCRWSTTDQTYSSMPNTFTTTNSTSHSTTVGGLTNGQAYTRYVRCQDVAGNPMTTSQSVLFNVSTASNNAPNAPSQDLPVSASQNLSMTPVFRMTATDVNGDRLQYRVVIYSSSVCTTAIQTNDQGFSQIGWSGQNATCVSGSDCYNSGTQGTFTTQVALAQNTTYYWRASAKDPLGSNSWTNSSACSSFTTTGGNFTTDSGNWSVLSNQLVVTPPSGSSVQLHATDQNQTNGVIEFRAKVSAVGAGTGSAGGIVRANSAGSSLYWLGVADVINQRHAVSRTVSGVYSVISSLPFAFGADTFYQFRGRISVNSLNSWINGGTAVSTTDTSIPGSGFLGFAASSVNGTATFTYDNIAFYTSTAITLNGLPAGGSWAVRNSAGAVISCRTGGAWDLATYSGQVPIDYDNGGGSIAVWGGNITCSGVPTVTYPSSGFANDIFGGDIYSYSFTGGSGPQPSVVAVSTITVSANGLISF